MAEIAIANIINVNLSSTPTGTTERNLNIIGLFTNETPSNVDTYREYISAADVGTDYGTSSVTYQMATAIFSQSPNIRSGSGALIIMPTVATSATGGSLTTPDISGNITNFTSVTDGEFTISINGTDLDVSGINFAGSSDIDDVAQVIQNKLQDVVVSVDGNTIVFESKKVGSTSEITISTLSGGTGTDISDTGFLNVASGSAVVGTDSSGETLSAAISRMEEEVFFGAVLTNVDLEDTAIVTAANSIQAMDKMWVHHASSTEDIEGLATTISDAGLDQTRIITYTLTNQADANLCKSAYAGRMFSMDTKGSNTSITANLKELKTILPDTNLTQTDYSNAKTAGTDLYVSYEGTSRTLSTGGNDYFDNIYFKIQYKFALEAKGFNYLATTQTKIAQTESGMTGLKSEFNEVADRFVTNGFIGTGLEWNSADTFGDPEIFNNNITNKGYYTYSQPIAEQDQADRESRIAPTIQHAVKLAGAIHIVNFSGIIES